MANFAILRIEKRKMGSVTPINNHHERLKEKYKSNEDIDPERTHLNYHLVEPEGKYKDKLLSRIEDAGAKRRKDSVVLQDVLITASPDWIDEKSYIRFQLKEPLRLLSLEMYILTTLISKGLKDTILIRIRATSLFCLM